jgi:flagellar biosynthesis protein
MRDYPGNKEPLHSNKAVALRYDAKESNAPVIIAKGKGHIAQKILDKAKEHGIPVQEDPSLVEVLSQFDLNQEIPPELYQLVAEILSFIYLTDRQAGQHES